MSSRNLSHSRARLVARLIANFECTFALLYLVSSRTHLTSLRKHAWSKWVYANRTALIDLPNFSY